MTGPDGVAGAGGAGNPVKPLRTPDERGANADGKGRERTAAPSAEKSELPLTTMPNHQSDVTTPAVPPRWEIPRRPDGSPYALPREAVLTAEEVRHALGGNGRPLSEATFESLGLPYANMGAGEAKHRNRRYLWGAVLDRLFGEQAA